MVRFSAEELGQTIGPPIVNTVLDTAGIGLDTMCNLYRTVPYNVMPFAFNTPATRFLRSTWASLCGPRGAIPPAPQPQFNGGQCPTAYTVNVSAGFNRKSDGLRVDLSGSQVFPGPIRGVRFQRGTPSEFLEAYIQHGAGETRWINVNTATNENITTSIASVVRFDGQPDVCGNPAPTYPPALVENVNTNITYQNNDGLNVTVPLLFAPVTNIVNVVPRFTVNIDGVDFNFDAGGVDIDFNFGGGGGGGFTAGDRTTINNTNNIVTTIRNQQEECCDEILSAIQSLRNLMVQRFDSVDDVLKCIEALERENAELIPRFEDPIAIRASGSSGDFGSTFYVQPSRADSCFLIIEATPSPDFNGRVYTLREDATDIEAGMGHVERAFFTGLLRPPSTAGVDVITSRFTLIEFPYISSGNQIRVSLKGGIDYTITDPGFRWRPRVLPDCEDFETSEQT